MNGLANSLRVTAAGGQLVVSGDTRQRGTVGATAFFRSLPRLPPPRAIDLLMIAIGAYAADRMVLRHGLQSDYSGIRTFEITFEVQDPVFWSQPEITERIVDVLSFLTDDNWSVSFEQSAENWYQVILPIKWFSPTRIALFSEGLDSAAGLADQALRGSDRILLVTIGHYAALRRRAERQILNLAELIPELCARHASLVISLRGGVARRLRFQEKTQRSRAFLFCAAAITAAAACEVRDIDIYENGVGAINLPPMTGMLFGGLATRGAHPSLLQKMSVLGSLVADQTIAFSLPYKDLTKGELVAGLRGRGLDRWLQQSRSCIHTSPRIIGMPHCGVCPGCIERRLAFAIARIDEDSGKYLVDMFGHPTRKNKHDYFDVLFEQSSALLSGDPVVLRRIHAHLCGSEVDFADHDRIRQLLCRNADEVQRVFSSARERLSASNRAAIESGHPSLASTGVAS